jgi:hypothetical protein
VTVATIAPFPWGLLRRILDNFAPTDMHDLLILATDSRWTYADRAPEDMGQKLWKLDETGGVGAVFAGDVRSAEEGLETARRRLKLLISPSPETVVDVVSKALGQVYEAHKALRKDLGPLYVLLGVAWEGGTSILRLSSGRGFHPELTDDIQVIGWPSACEKLMVRLQELEDESRSGSTAWMISPDEWALRLVGALFTHVIEPGQEVSVGGGVQIAIMGPSLWRDITVVRLPWRQPNAQWERISIDPGKVKRLREEFNLPPLADGDFALGFYSVGDGRISAAALSNAKPAPSKATARR